MKNKYFYAQGFKVTKICNYFSAITRSFTQFLKVLIILSGNSDLIFLEKSSCNSDQIFIENSTGNSDQIFLEKSSCNSD